MTLAEAFASIFEGNPLAHYTWKPGFYTEVDRGINEDDIARHLRGEEPGLLSIPVLPSGLCHFAAGDCDRHHESDEALDHAAVARKITELGLPLIITRSKSPKSAHVWIFFKEAGGFSAADARRLIEKYLAMLEISGITEIFPKQETLKLDASTGERQKGSGINLPYFLDARIAFGRDGQELDLAGFIALVRERQAFGQILAKRDLTGAPESEESKGRSDRPLPVEIIRSLHEKNLKALQDSNLVGHWNDTLNTTAFFAGRAFAAKIFTESEEEVKDSMRKAAAATDGWNERQMEATLESGWESGITQPLKILHIGTPAAINRPDMPESVLDGKLGKWCRERLSEFPIAYSWPSMLSSASVLVKPHAKYRVNVFVGLVGPIHSGKSQAQERANYLFNVKGLGLLEELKSGSAEGLLEKIGDRQGDPVLWWPDELSHLLEKAQIEHSSFPFVLNSIFYSDTNMLTVAHRKRVNFFARLSLTGGLVEENFGDSFGATTTAGLYDRFLFGICPSDFKYAYRPMSGPPLFDVKNVLGKDLFSGPGEGKETTSNIVTPEIHSDVWDARDALRKKENIEPRVLEIAIRAALICAAWDRKQTLRASDLGPAWELARYQQRVRALLQPNPGRNFEGIVAIKILNFLKANSDGQKWIPWRDVYRATHIMRYGPSTADRAVSSMVFAGEVEQTEVQTKGGGRGKRLLRLPLED